MHFTAACCDDAGEWLKTCHFDHVEDGTIDVNKGTTEKSVEGETGAANENTSAQ